MSQFLCLAFFIWQFQLDLNLYIRTLKNQMPLDFIPMEFIILSGFTENNNWLIDCLNYDRTTENNYSKNDFCYKKKNCLF